MQKPGLLIIIVTYKLGDLLASYPDSNYAGEEKRAWYILHAHALNFQRILWICILSVFLRV